VGTRRAKTARAKRSSPAPSVDTPTTRTRTRRGTSSPVLYRAGLALRGGNVRRVAAMPRPQFPTNREPLLWPLGVSRNPPPSGGGGCQRRIDALMFDGPQRTAVEIKTNRQDVKRETFSKTAPFKRIAHRFVYAVPAGLIDPTDMVWA